MLKALLLVLMLWALALFWVERRDRGEIGRRLEQIRRHRRAEEPEAPAPPSRLAGRLPERSVLVRRLALRLAAAGSGLYPWEAIALLFALSLPLAVLLWPLLGIAALLLAPTALAVLGQLWLRRQALRRQEAATGYLPDVLQLMAQSLRSGHALLQAFELAAREAPEPLAGEFSALLRETRLGVPLEEALQAFARRIGTREAELLATAVIIQRQVGGNLAELLDHIETTIRERLRIRGEVRALTAQGRISGWIVGLLPPVIAILVSAMDPGYLGTLFATKLGHVILLVSLVLELIGVYTIQRILRVEY